MKRFLLSISFLFVPLLLIAQEAERSLDERVNDAFMPVAVWWENLVLTTVPLGIRQICADPWQCQSR